MSSRLLINLAPKTAAQFDVNANLGIAELASLSVSSNRVAHWRCPEGPDHLWPQRIDARTAWGDLALCPFCTNRRLSITNSLATRHPDLAAEFDLAPNAPATPSSVIAARTTRRYHWRCSAGHAYTARLSHRLEGHGCPSSSCSSSGMSRPHQRLGDALLQVRGSGVLLNKSVDGITSTGSTKKWEADILLDDLNVVIEYDGYYHKDRIERDLRKTADLTRAGYRVVRVRESPLQALGPDDVVIHRDDTPAALAGILTYLGWACPSAECVVLAALLRR
jgi:hypothetical protein